MENMPCLPWGVSWALLSSDQREAWWWCAAVQNYVNHSRCEAGRLWTGLGCLGVAFRGLGEALGLDVRNPWDEESAT